MKKKILSIIVCIGMILVVMAGCTSQEENASSDDIAYKIGVSVLTMSGQFFIDMVDAAQKEAEQIGAELIVNDAKNSAEKQVAALENFISAGVDGIIITAVDPEAVAPVIAEAKRTGIVVIAHTSKVEGYNAYIGADEYQLGYTQGTAVGKWIAEKWGTDEGVKAATLNYDLLESVIQRKVGIMEGIQKYAPYVKFVADATAADQAEGMTATENFLQAHPDLRIVCAVSDGAALGAYEAFKANKMIDPNKYIIAGVDATDEALNKIKEGTIYQFTVDQNPSGTGKKLVDTFVAVKEGKEFVKDNNQDLVAVTPENISEYK